MRAKAMAIIMNLDGEHSCMDEVHILIGPKVDVKIKMMVDGYGDIDEQGVLRRLHSACSWKVWS